MTKIHRKNLKIVQIFLNLIINLILFLKKKFLKIELTQKKASNFHTLFDPNLILIFQKEK